MRLFFKGCLTLLFIVSCSDAGNDTNPVITDTITSGTGVFNYTYSQGSSAKTLRIYYHVPAQATPTTRLLLVLHGAGRNARDYRDALIHEANRKQVIVIAPEFSIQNFAGGDGYNLGNVFIDGDNPSEASLNNENDWAFSVIEPLFDNLLAQLQNTSNTYDLFGHSAGGQFVHRFLMFKPTARVDKAVVSAGGWYTIPDNSVSFPYGFNNSPLANSSLTALLNRKIHVQVGANDDDPNAASLRRNTAVDVQGTTRKARATYFFNYSQNLANTLQTPFRWSFNIIPNADHDYAIAATQAAQFLYTP